MKIFQVLNLSFFGFKLISGYTSDFTSDLTSGFTSGSIFDRFSVDSKLNHFLIKKLKTFTTRCFCCDWFLGSANQIVACYNDVIWLPRCFCTLPFRNFKWFWTCRIVCIAQIFPILIHCPIFVTFKGQSRLNEIISKSFGVTRVINGIPLFAEI